MSLKFSFYLVLHNLPQPEIRGSFMETVEARKPKPDLILTLKLTWVNVSTQHIAAGRNMLPVFGHPVATRWVLLAQIWSWSNLIRHPTRRNRVTKHTIHVAPNNVVICYVDVLQSFGRAFKHGKKRGRESLRLNSGTIDKRLWLAILFTILQ